MQHRQPGTRKVDIALLRIAYLLAFSVLGYGLILHSTFQRVRNQLNKPIEHILPGRWALAGNAYPSIGQGLNLVRESEDLEAWLVLFDLVSPNGRKIPYAIILPTPRDPEMEVYKRYEERGRAGDPAALSLSRIPEDPLDAQQYRAVRQERFTVWNTITGVQMMAYSSRSHQDIP